MKIEVESWIWNWSNINYLESVGVGIDYLSLLIVSKYAVDKHRVPDTKFTEIKGYKGATWLEQWLSVYGV